MGVFNFYRQRLPYTLFFVPVLCAGDDMRCVWFVSQLLPPLSYLLFLHKVHIGGAFDLHRLALPVIQRQHEVEEVGLPQIGRRLLLEVSTG